MGARPPVFGTGALAGPRRGAAACYDGGHGRMDAWTPANVVVSALAAIVAILLAAVGFFLRRTISQNDEAHRELKGGIGEVRTDLGEVKTDVADLKTDVADLKTNVAVIRTIVEERGREERGRQD